MQDEAVRSGLKELSNWPTYPQLYINGELAGGCDIGEGRSAGRGVRGRCAVTGNDGA